MVLLLSAFLAACSSDAFNGQPTPAKPFLPTLVRILGITPDGAIVQEGCSGPGDPGQTFLMDHTAKPAGKTAVAQVCAAFAVASGGVIYWSGLNPAGDGNSQTVATRGKNILWTRSYGKRRVDQTVFQNGNLYVLLDSGYRGYSKPEVWKLDPNNDKPEILPFHLPSSATDVFLFVTNQQVVVLADNMLFDDVAGQVSQSGMSGTHPHYLDGDSFSMLLGCANDGTGTSTTLAVYTMEMGYQEYPFEQNCRDVYGVSRWSRGLAVTMSEFPNKSSIVLIGKNPGPSIVLPGNIRPPALVIFDGAHLDVLYGQGNKGVLKTFSGTTWHTFSLSGKVQTAVGQMACTAQFCFVAIDDNGTRTVQVVTLP
ncbi:MAG TPA: hypothetical protein VNG90_04265 [Candidatus Acidoferrum sp.]|nr:hypothetical protein [Candidatus Acidoferrum sp.]